MIDYSIVMTVHNTRPDYLFEALFSITKGQVKKNNAPVIIVNDGSTHQDTLMALDMIAQWEPITVYDIEGNAGTPNALNVAHSRVETPWVLQMDSDDIAHPHKLEAQFRMLEKYPEADVIGTNLFCFWEGDITRTPFFRSTHRERPQVRKGDNPYWLTNHGTVLMRKEKVAQAGGYNPELRRAQDVELWKRMHGHGFKFVNVEAELYAWRRYRK